MDLHRSKDKNEMMATFELPGLTKDNVEIAVHNNRLVISGQCAPSEGVNDEGYAVHERRFGRFSRTLPLPSGTKVSGSCFLDRMVNLTNRQPEDIKAEMNNGVLMVKFPKSQPEKEVKKIAIS
jgi:HSP20 family protein